MRQLLTASLLRPERIRDVALPELESRSTVLVISTEGAPLENQSEMRRLPFTNFIARASIHCEMTPL
jgi:hypothetical protein